MTREHERDGGTVSVVGFRPTAREQADLDWLAADLGREAGLSPLTRSDALRAALNQTVERRRRRRGRR